MHTVTMDISTNEEFLPHATNGKRIGHYGSISAWSFLMSIKARFIAAMGANLTTPAISALIQICSVPIFLHVWSLEEYGAWLILSAVPTYFALSDIGFLAVIINKMSMAAAAGDGGKAKVLFHSAIKLYLYVLGAAVILASIVAVLLNHAPFGSIQNKLALVIMVIATVLAMTSALVDAVFRSKGEFALGTQIGNVARLIEWVGLIVGVLVSRTFLGAAVGYLCACLFTAVIKWALSSRCHPEFRWSTKDASWEELRSLLKPAAAFMAFPLGNAISIQGMTLLVGHLFGPAFVAIFNSYRTIARIQTQAITIIGRSLWPEISRQAGSGKFGILRKLYARGTIASVAVGAATSLVLLFFGSQLLQLWTAGRIPHLSALFNLFIAATFLTSAWQMGQVTLSAINRHEVLSIAFLTASIASLALTLVLKPMIGESSAVVTLIGFELVMMVLTFILMKIFFEGHK